MGLCDSDVGQMYCRPPLLLMFEMSVFVVHIQSCAFILARFIPQERRYMIYDNGYLLKFRNRAIENKCVQLLKDRGFFYIQF